MLTTTVAVDSLEKAGLAQSLLLSLEPAMKKDDRLAYLLALIKERYTDSSLRLSEVVEEAHVSLDHLNRLLRKACGITFKQLHIQLRVAEAVEVFLNEPGAIVEEVAQRVGFNDISNFVKQFKRRLGCVPKVLKKLFFIETPRRSIFAQSLCRLHARLAACCTEKKLAGFVSWLRHWGLGPGQGAVQGEKPGPTGVVRLTGGARAVSSGP